MSEVVIREDIESEIIIVGLEGPQGPAGASAYEIAVAAGFVGSQQDWLDQFGSQLVNTHIADPTPHPAYDDLPSLKILFENGLI